MSSFIFQIKLILIVLFSKFHRFVFEKSSGRLMGTLLGQKMMLLYTIGRHSKKLRKTPLLFIKFEGEIYCAASFAGNDKHPDWYKNLVNYPYVKILSDGKIRQAKSELLKGTSRDSAWGILCKTYPPYSDYQNRTSRKIPVIKFTYI